VSCGCPEAEDDLVFCWLCHRVIPDADAEPYGQKERIGRRWWPFPRRQVLVIFYRCRDGCGRDVIDGR
jgi:hypothetical protein